MRWYKKKSPTCPRRVEVGYDPERDMVGYPSLRDDGSCRRAETGTECDHPLAIVAVNMQERVVSVYDDLAKLIAKTKSKTRRGILVLLS